MTRLSFEVSNPLDSGLSMTISALHVSRGTFVTYYILPWLVDCDQWLTFSILKTEYLQLLVFDFLVTSTDFLVTRRIFVTRDEFNFYYVLILFFSAINECEIFGDNICKNGQCFDTRESFRCQCNTGYLYNPSTFNCEGKFTCNIEYLYNPSSNRIVCT